MSLYELPGTLETGFIFGIVALGAYLTFQILGFPDLTVEGSFPLGAAVAAVLMVGAGWNSWIATLGAGAAGLVAGYTTAWLNVRFNILHILAGILVGISLYSINLRIMGGPNEPFLRLDTIFISLEIFNLPGYIVNPIFLGIAVLGISMPASSANPAMAEANGVNAGNMKLYGVGVANALAATAGGLFAQIFDAADVYMRIDVIIVGLASVIVGMSILPSGPIFLATFACIVGAILYRLPVTFGKNTLLEIRALRGVDLNIPKDQFLTIIGSNGAGKSTSLNVIAGFARAEQGRVKVDGRDVIDWPVHKRSTMLSRVFQDPKMGTCEDLSILENFALAYGRTKHRGLRYAVTSQMRDETAVRIKVLGLGLEDRLNNKVGLLSRGQRQAVRLLMAGTDDTKVLLLDEHTAALDPKTADFVLKLTRDIISGLGLTAVMVTHSMAQALDTGRRTVMFHQEKIIFDTAGAEREKLEVKDLLELFKKQQGEEIADDSLLLG